jgi:protocatechuate 3,4-dioxygenase beta subunit
MRNRKLKVCLIILFALVSTLTAHAQSNTGIVRGTVTDQSGAAIPGAIVTLANPLTNYTQTAAAADSRGAYQLIDVPFGRYKLAIEAAQGFALRARDQRQLESYATH